MINSLQISPDQAEFVILSFEGPDPYAQAGGLGVRVSHLASELARKGFHTHLFFIGDPYLPGFEAQPVEPGPAATRSTQPGLSPLSNGAHPVDSNGHGFPIQPVQVYRWGQWISRHFPHGVYDGEETKLDDWNHSLPAYVVEHIARPAIAANRNIIVLAEEWHTAFSLILLSDLLHSAGLRDRCVLLWNANNTMGFDRIDWKRLSFTATLTTVSRYMKQIMRGYGLDPLIIPNGIPSELLQPVPRANARRLRESLAGPDTYVMFKVGRFDPAKCWSMALETAAELKHSGEKVLFLARGGIEPHGMEVLHQARKQGLAIREVMGNPETWEGALELILDAGPADLYNLRFFMPQSMLRVFYAAADVVLANSKHEPFGLVGLEAMAAGGIVFTGPTGETYSAVGEGAIALDTETAAEITLNLHNLALQPEWARALRSAAPRVASRFTWEAVLGILYEKIVLAANQQHIHPVATCQPALSPSGNHTMTQDAFFPQRRLHMSSQLRVFSRPGMRDLKRASQSRSEL